MVPKKCVGSLRSICSYFIYVGYIKKLLTRFGMQDCKGAKTPMDAKIQPEQVDPADFIVDTKPYRELIGCLMYLMLCTMADNKFRPANF
jgi:hypothetical protein